MDFHLIENILKSNGLSSQFKHSSNTCAIVLVSNACYEAVVKIKPSKFTVNLHNEACHLSSFDHKNIVKYIDFHILDNFVLLEMEKVEGINLCDYLISKGKLSEEECRSIFRQIILAMSYLLYEKSRVHLDIKPDNFVYDPKTGIVKLIDFETCEKINLKKIKLLKKIGNEGNLTVSVGTNQFMSPEVQKKKYFGPEADVWSLGATLFSLVSGRFFDSNTFQKFSSSNEYSDSLKDLLKKMLEKNGKERISLKEIQNHKWLKERIKSLNMCYSSPL